ncbi:hypothetical protein JHK85_028647 [Glycine max]|nr:hypothetical protein JHK85_028647 [Glycine max]
MAFVAYGVVLQYDKGDFLKAFSRRLGHCTILKAKLWAILFGMNMACDSSYKAIIIETDFVEAIELVEDPRYHEDQFVDLSSKIVKTKEKHVSLSLASAHILQGSSLSLAKTLSPNPAKGQK